MFYVSNAYSVTQAGKKSGVSIRWQTNKASVSTQLNMLTSKGETASHIKSGPPSRNILLCRHVNVVVDMVLQKFVLPVVVQSFSLESFKMKRFLHEKDR